MAGYLSVAIAYLLTKAGVSVEEVAGLTAISLIPQTWKFLWAPIADTTLGRKTWYLIACVLAPRSESWRWEHFRIRERASRRSPLSP